MSVMPWSPRTTAIGSLRLDTVAGRVWLSVASETRVLTEAEARTLRDDLDHRLAQLQEARP